MEKHINWIESILEYLPKTERCFWSKPFSCYIFFSLVFVSYNTNTLSRLVYGVFFFFTISLIILMENAPRKLLETNNNRFENQIKFCDIIAVHLITSLRIVEICGD